VYALRVGADRTWRSQERAADGSAGCALGKTANCQTLVSLTLARGEVLPVMLAGE